MNDPDFTLATDLFEKLRVIGQLPGDDVSDASGASGTYGVTRDTYGRGEQAAHELVADTARRIGLEVRTDAALNLYMTFPGHDRLKPVRMTGSHLDSVPQGGNFDGAAGVVAGLAVLAGWRRSGYVPPVDVTVMAIRAEESVWFPLSYIGSKAAFGLLPPHALGLPRHDNQETLAQCLSRCGGDPERVLSEPAFLDAKHIACFAELHIEQGPVLVEAGEATAVVTGICGSLRYRHARVLGAYQHSGATPRTHRQDAVIGAASMTLALHRAWQEMEASGHELTLTIGQFNTDPARADISKVAGQVDLSIDIRSRHQATLSLMEEHVFAAVARAEAEFGITVTLGDRTQSEPAEMNTTLRRLLHEQAEARGLACRDMASGAGHDAALFANQGIPTAMIFVRNANGSHNPDEAMALADFELSTGMLAGLLGAPDLHTGSLSNAS